MTENNKKISVGELLTHIFLYLFLIGGIGGFLVNSFFSFKYKWLSVLSFTSVLPMVNIWIWQALVDKKGKVFANKTAIVIALISVCLTIYVFNIGSLGIIPLILIGIAVTAYFLWIFLAFFISVELWWQKALVVIIAAGLISWGIFIRTGITTVDCDRVSDIVYMDIFENLTPPIVKKDLLKEKGTPDDIQVDYEEEEDGDGGYSRYKREVWKYKRDAGDVKVAFIDDDYDDGFIGISPVGLTLLDLLKDTSIIRNKSKRAYKIKLKAQDGKRITIHANKDNTIEYIHYYDK